MKGSVFDYLVYCAARIPYLGIRALPHGAVRILARCAGQIANLLPSFRHLVQANIHTALPELPEKEVRRIARESFFHLFYNMLEYLWLDGKPERIRRWYHLPDQITEKLKAHVVRGERIIFVNPHLGSWEASGVMAPFYAGVKMVAIAKPVRNPYLNDFLNHGNREKTPGLRIIFSRGAIRAALKALNDGYGLGTLVDQNTRVRDGGIFVNFFGLPVAGSPSPAVLKGYCDAHGIPSVIVYGTSLRTADGKITAHSAYLSRPFEEYADEREVMEELMHISEGFIRRYPEQYLWLYKRFQYISPESSAEQLARYPYYARVPDGKFFRKTEKAGPDEK